MNQPTAEQIPAAWPHSLDRLVDGLVHDFNNLITGIHALSEGLRFQPDATPAEREAFEHIQSSALKAREIVQRLVVLQRARPGTKAYHNLNELVTETMELMRKSIPRSVQTVSTLNGESLAVYLDAVAFRQALVGLTFALSQNMVKGSKLRFETSQHREAPAGQRSPGKPKEFPWVCLTVKAAFESSPASVALISPRQDMLPTIEQATACWHSFAANHGGILTEKPSLPTESVLCIWLPTADFAEADSG